MESFSLNKKLSRYVCYQNCLGTFSIFQMSQNWLLPWVKLKKYPEFRNDFIIKLLTVWSHLHLNDQQLWYCTLLTIKKNCCGLNQIQPSIKHQMQTQTGFPHVYITALKCTQ